MLQAIARRFCVCALVPWAGAFAAPVFMPNLPDFYQHENSKLDAPHPAMPAGAPPYTDTTQWWEPNPTCTPFARFGAPTLLWR